MMSLTFGLFTQVSGSGPLGPLVYLPRVYQICVISGSLSVCSESIDKGNHYV